MYSPFFGGGSFELSSGLEVYGNDLFQPLIVFWKCASSKNSELVKVIRKLKEDITKEKLIEYRRQLREETTPDLMTAAYYFAINRSSFSGATFSGGFSEEAIQKRFTESSIVRLENLDLVRCTFTCLDYATFLKTVPENESSFIYADPPYYLGKKSTLYGNKGDLHIDFDHVSLYHEITSKKCPWLISYNDCDFIRDLYSKFTIQTLSWSYGMSKDKTSKEILIYR